MSFGFGGGHTIYYHIKFLSLKLVGQTSLSYVIGLRLGQVVPVSQKHLRRLKTFLVSAKTKKVPPSSLITERVFGNGSLTHGCENISVFLSQFICCVFQSSSWKIEPQLESAEKFVFKKVLNFFRFSGTR